MPNDMPSPSVMTHSRNHPQSKVFAKTNELIEAGVTEADISKWIVNGSDPHNLGSNRSIYKCALQFMDRVKLVNIFVGDEPVPPDTTCGDLASLLSKICGSF